MLPEMNEAAVSGSEQVVPGPGVSEVSRRLRAQRALPPRDRAARARTVCSDDDPPARGVGSTAEAVF